MCRGRGVDQIEGKEWAIGMELERPKRYNAIPGVRYLQHIYAETREQAVLDSADGYCLLASMHQMYRVRCSGMVSG